MTNDLTSRSAPLKSRYNCAPSPNDSRCAAMVVSVSNVEKAPDVNTIQIPCKIGDFVWANRCYKGVLHPQEGRVSEMFFTPDMRLQIVVKHIARGEWGKEVFPTREAAAAAIAVQETKERAGGL